jgi:hypothetical protein
MLLNSFKYQNTKVLAAAASESQRPARGPAASGSGKSGKMEDDDIYRHRITETLNT